MYSVSLYIDTNQGFDTNGKKNKIPKAPLSSKSISNSNRSSRDRSSNNAAAQATGKSKINGFECVFCIIYISIILVCTCYVVVCCV